VFVVMAGVLGRVGGLKGSGDVWEANLREKRKAKRRPAGEKMCKSLKSAEIQGISLEFRSLHNKSWLSSQTIAMATFDVSTLGAKFQRTIITAPSGHAIDNERSSMATSSVNKLPQ
jgi:hypothetical protein